ncbi:MAG: prepilin-type N-terminal cleavage/methylation domain-containing protein [Candidatus Falkowbacteria bacterium]|nr:prepilin-type N-terminal cleavage/methylation domain-containing protein [Candidatus Falkowbacteria bacterium]
MYICNNKKGFTLIELLVVIAIIGVLSTMAIIALGNARAKARDSKRVADIKQISTALELYYSDYNSYPTIITPGNALTSPDGTKTYMASIPNNPTPRNDSGCGDNNYTYASTPDNTNYSLNFCLGNNVSSTPAGINSSSSTGVGTAPGLVGWWKFDEGIGNAAIDSSGNNNNGTWYGTGAHYVAGKTGAYAGQFNGTDDSVLVPDNVTIDFGQNNFSWSAWVKLSSPQNSRNFIFEKGYEPSSNAYYGFWGELDIGNAYVGGMGCWGAPCAGINQSVNYGALSPISEWHFYTQVYNQTNNQFLFYVDGQLRTPPTAFNLMNANNNLPLFIGRDGQGNANMLKGLIDDARLYNRAISAFEVLALYNSTK